ncbi:MAG: antitoxin [Acidobacteria bacterium]|nr:MAG: antitoxin [Acidobacteriota bacterium]
MGGLDRRLQVLIDQDRHDRLAAIAERRGVSVASVVREAIDRGLPDLADRKDRAARRLLDSPDMPVPEPPELREELERLRGRRTG